MLQPAHNLLEGRAEFLEPGKVGERLFNHLDFSILIPKGLQEKSVDQTLLQGWKTVCALTERAAMVTAMPVRNVR